MAVSGLQQRRVPLVMSSSIWSPWGPGVVAPYPDFDIDEHDDHDELPKQQQLRRSQSWGNFSTHAQLASRGLPLDEDSQSEPETPPTAVSDRILAGRGRRKQRSRKIHLRQNAAPQLQPAPVPRAATRGGQQSKPVLLGSRQPDNEAKQVVGCVMSGPQSQLSAIATKPRPAKNTEKITEKIAEKIREEIPITTLAIRNLPFGLKQQDLLQAVDESGFAGLYDYFYLPHKFKEHRNLGFAFINFVSEDVARKFTAEWQHTDRFVSKGLRQPVNICPAAVQGRKANEQSATSHKMDRVKNSAFRPLVLEGSPAVADVL